MSTTISLFSNQTSNGNSAEFTAAGVNPNTMVDPMLGISGDFDGAVIKLEWKDPNNDWQDTDSEEDTWTFGKLQPLYLNPYVIYRLNISNVGSSTDVSAWGFGCLAA